MPSARILPLAALALSFAATACAASVGLGGGLGASTGRSQGRERQLQGDDSSSSSSSSSWSYGQHGDDSLPVVDDVEVYHDKLVGLWSLEKILLKLIFKSFANIEESDRLVRIAASTGGLLNTTDSERAYELEDKLVWLLRELCRVVFSAAKVAFGQEHYAGFSWRGGYQDENKGIGHMGRLRSRQLTSSEGPKLAYWPVWMPYWPKPWPVTPNTTVPYFPPVDVEYAETKLKVLHDLLYGLKGLDYKALKLIKSVKEALRVLATATAADWDGSSSSSSSSHGVVNSRAAKVLAQLSKLEKELAWVLKEQVKFVLKLKEVAFRAPLFPSATPTPSASVTATASASTSASATATASASASASAAPLLPPIPPIDDLLEEELEEEEEEEEEEIAE